MAMAAQRLDYVDAGLQVYGKATETWKIDHRDAMACYAFEDHLQTGIEIFDSITKTDEDWRQRVLRKMVDYDPAVEERILHAYKEWLKPCRMVEEVLRHFEALFGQVRHADEFRSRCMEAKGIDAPDSEFFSGESLVDLCDDAIDDYRKGDVQDVGRG